MPAKLEVPEYDLTDVLTLLRMANGNSVRELIELHHYKRDSPISGDAIWCYTHAEEFVEALAETQKVEHNEGMDNNTSLHLSTARIFVTSLGIEVPATLTVHYADSDFDQVFTWDGEVFLDEEGNELYLEPGADGVITEETYFEVPESM